MNAQFCKYNKEKRKEGPSLHGAFIQEGKTDI